MTQGRLAGSSDPGSRKKLITIGAFVIVIGVIAWQVMALFGGDASPPPAPAKSAMNAGMPGGASQQQTPRPAELPKAPVLTEREQALVQMQQETEAKYLAALTELQVLKLEKEIALTNKDIATARLDTVTAQKDVVDLLSPPPPPTQNYAGTLAAPTASGTGGGPMGDLSPTLQPEVTYTVISVTQLESKWNAVLGYQGTLYQVAVGDVIPADSSKVISIDKSGVVLEKNGVQKKISMVPII